MLPQVAYDGLGDLVQLPGLANMMRRTREVGCCSGVEFGVAQYPKAELEGDLVFGHLAITDQPP